MIFFDIGLDLFPMLAGTLAAITCGLLGNFLVLRKLSLMGDAISHSVLPGLVIAFLIASTRSPLVMFLGAAVAGIVTVILVELVQKLGRVEPGAAMGVVFSVMFALGVLLIERAAVRHVDLDADCVLHGQLENLAWYGAPQEWSGLLQWSSLQAVPRQVTALLITCALAFGFVVLLFKELRLAAFDPAMATTQGFSAGLMHYLLMIFVAAATVASFDAVGSILVIAMLVCPAATARLLTDRLLTQIIWSVVIAAATGVLGYFAATSVPALFDKDSVNAAGSMTIVAGALLVLAMIVSPSHGLVVKLLRRRALAASVAREDLLAALFRASERDKAGLSVDELRLSATGRMPTATIASAARAGLVVHEAGRVSLTPDGRNAAVDLIRKHRLWEHYLVDKAGFAPDHVHDAAERLEHVPIGPTEGPAVDPHGKQIPSKEKPSN